jgi:hypothetical protein
MPMVGKHAPWCIGHRCLGLVATPDKPKNVQVELTCWPAGACLHWQPSTPGPKTAAPDQRAHPAKSATDLLRRRCRTELPVPRRRPYTSFLGVVNPPCEYLAANVLVDLSRNTTASIRRTPAIAITLPALEPLSCPPHAGRAGGKAIAPPPRGTTHAARPLRDALPSRKSLRTWPRSARSTRWPDRQGEKLTRTRGRQSQVHTEPVLSMLDRGPASPA